MNIKVKRLFSGLMFMAVGLPLRGGGTYTIGNGAHGAGYFC